MHFHSGAQDRAIPVTSVPSQESRTKQLAEYAVAGGEIEPEKCRGFARGEPEVWRGFELLSNPLHELTKGHRFLQCGEYESSTVSMGRRALNVEHGSRHEIGIPPRAL